MKKHKQTSQKQQIRLKSVSLEKFMHFEHTNNHQKYINISNETLLRFKTASKAFQKRFIMDFYVYLRQKKTSKIHKNLQWNAFEIEVFQKRFIREIYVFWTHEKSSKIHKNL